VEINYVRTDRRKSESSQSHENTA